MAKREITAGSIDQTIDIFVNSSAVTTGAGLTGLAFNTASLTCYYRKGATGTPTALVLATQTVGGVHSDGGFVAVDSTNCPGQYRLDLSDTIVATAGMVTLYLHGAANMVPCVTEIEVVSINKFDSVRMGLTALPNANAGAAGGLPTDSAGKTSFNDIAATAVVSAGAITTSAGAVTTVTTATNVTTVNGLAANVITAASITADAITAAKIADGAITAAKFAANALDAVWSTATRVLTASTNISAGIATAVWAEGTRTLTAATNITAGIATAVWSESVRVLTAATNLSIPSAATIAAAVWDYLTSAATTVGSMGKLAVDNINATISSRLASASYTTPLDAAGTRTAVGLASANLDTQIGLLATAANLATLAGKFTGITLLAEWLGLIAGKQTGNTTALTELRASGAGSGTYDETTDALQAIRDRGDAAWTSGGGGGGVAVIFAPVLTQLESRIKPFNATLYVNDLGAVSLAVYAWSATTNTFTPTNLTTYGAMTLRIVDGRGAAVQTVLNASLTISGSDSNLLGFTPDAATVGTVRTLQASLRKDSNGLVVAHGEFEIKYLP